MRRFFITSFSFFFLCVTSSYASPSLGEAIPIWCAKNLSETYSMERYTKDKNSGLNDDQICHFYPRFPKHNDPRWLPEIKMADWWIIRTDTHLFRKSTRVYDAFEGWGKNFLFYNWISLAITSYKKPFEFGGGWGGTHVPEKRSPGWYKRELAEELTRLGLPGEKFTGGDRYYVSSATPRLGDHVTKAASGEPLAAGTYYGKDAKGNDCWLEIESVDWEFHRTAVQFPILQVSVNGSAETYRMSPGASLDKKLELVSPLDRFWGGVNIQEVGINFAQASQVELYLDDQLGRPAHFNFQVYKDLIKTRPGGFTCQLN